MPSITNYTYRVERLITESSSMMVWYTNEAGESKLQEVRLPSVGETVDSVVAASCPFLPHIAAAMATVKTPPLPVIGQTGGFQVIDNSGIVIPSEVPITSTANPSPPLSSADIATLISNIRTTTPV